MQQVLRELASLGVESTADLTIPLIPKVIARAPPKSVALYAGQPSCRDPHGMQLC